MADLKMCISFYIEIGFSKQNNMEVTKHWK